MKFHKRILRSFLVLGIGAAACWPTLESRAADEDERFWSFQPVRADAPPPVRDRDWVLSPVDQFILAQLEKRGLTPAPVAERRTLLRRATFDLTGLPPTPKEIAG